MPRLVNLNRLGRIAVLVLICLAAGIFLANYFLETAEFRFDWYNGLELLGFSKPIDVLQEFHEQMELMDIKAVLIEPRILYESLDIMDQNLLLEKGFTFNKPTNNISVVSFALIGHQVSTLHKVLSRRQNSIKFKYWAAINQPENSSWIPSIYSSNNPFVGHHFFQLDDTLIHGIAFYNRRKYFWHSSLPENVELPVPRDQLTFVNESAYDKFSTRSEKNKENQTVRYFKPHTILPFLIQIESSQFIECDIRRASHLKEADYAKTPRYNSLKETFLKSLNEMKMKLYPQLKAFFIFGGTLLGWYRQCDIIPYTSDVDYAAFSSDIGSETFWTKTFTGPHATLKLGELMGLPEKGFELSFRLYGKKVDLFFIYRNDSMSWGYGHRPSKGYYFSYNYPKFRLCSGELLGEKVLVPCTAEEVIVAEYGPNWRKPVSGWYYETNPRNMGARQYWTAKERKRASKFFT